MPEFSVAGQIFGNDSPPVVVAEIGINHEGSIEVAKSMADAALRAGIRFIKHQTHIPDAEMSVEARDVVPGNAEKSIYEVISRCTLSEADEFLLKSHVESQGGVFFSTPFSREAADRLESWDVPLFKIGSGECNNYPLVEHVAKFGKPVILSTGMNSIASIRQSVKIFQRLEVPFALMHTTNLYPTPHRLLRLGGLADLAEAFPDAVVGLSDHSLSNSACIASVALGARILERHFTDSSTRPGPDIVCSMTPDDAKELVQASHEVFQSLGGAREAATEEHVTMAFAFSSVVSTRALNPGDTLSPENIWVKRPGGGDFSAAELTNLYGAKVVAPVQENHQIRKEHLSKIAGQGVA